MDLFDHPETLARLIAKLVGSYALDAIGVGEKPAEPATADGAADFVRAAGEARFEPFPAVGEGTDLRLASGDMCGGALEARGRVVHLCAFPGTRGNGHGLRGSGRMAALRDRRGARSGA